MEDQVIKYRKALQKRIQADSLKLRKYYRNALTKVQADIDRLYREAGKDGKLDPQKVRAFNGKMTRLEAVRKQILVAVKELEGKEYALLKDRWAWEYQNAYYVHGFYLQQSAGIYAVTPLLTNQAVVAVAAIPWVGARFSDRIRKNTAFLAAKMEEVISQAAVGGWSVQQAALEIRKRANEGWYNATRLARTELNRASAWGATELYKQNADILEGKRWLATLDRRTCPDDRAKDGLIFALDEGGIPAHPNCRCIWAPVISGLGVNTRSRIYRLNNKRDYTPARTYEDWAASMGITFKGAA